ncbi:ORF MSV192 hypothetical protein [Melanoplus sanguinipes entomopoxvirus]|uniref:N-acetyltransferase domain-containing protein n=1 Tax=Melanoplus sanguinipes entomopoxvirus TaxID=83191 RepID=Q9YVQ0_MSEPV|nr:ORF MSV192 hypothetical protein [Melanoplus sanguinipes entomopoxvirus]AAC97697.1 ORF MSV192 hypothetical protein [Melanoplus sanguinipes entomopoxvirus 'O']
MEKIKIFNKNEFNDIKKFQKENKLTNNALFNAWYEDKNPFCYCVIKNDKIICIVLLSHCDFSDKKYILNYIYTLKNYRRQGYAFKLVNYIKHKINFSVFCMNYESKKLFEKCGLFKM